MARITKKQLIASLEELLSSERVVIKLADLSGDEDAFSEWVRGEGPIKLTIDYYRMGIVRGVLHELLHVVLYDSLKSLGNTIEEWTIKKIEEKLWLEMTKEDLARWRTILKRKIGK
jgi:transposase